MGIRRALAAIIGLAALSGCAATARAPHFAGPTPACSHSAPEADHQVLFASTRQAECRPPWRLPAQRAAALVYGAVQLERKPLVVAISENESDWTGALRKRLDAAGGPGSRRALIYIHGYKNSADAALARAEAIAARSGFTGPVVAFLWPSYDSTLRYTWDENENLWAMRQARLVLERLAREADKVTLVAHSMGNRIAVDALGHLDRTKTPLAAKVDRVILASPDVDAEIFGEDLREIAPGRKVTIYASAKDRALRASRTVHGRRRAGDLRCWERRDHEPCPFAAAEKLVQIVDTRDFNNSLFGHDNFIEADEVAADMCRVIREEELHRTPIEGNLFKPAPDTVIDRCKQLQEDYKLRLKRR